MNIHEYQAKEILRDYNVPTPRGHVAFTPEEAVENAKKLGGKVWVVKAQIHAGGRGKAGGVKLAKSINEVKEFANEILGKTLITHQTGPEGKEVKKIYIEEGANIQAEYYLGMVLDRSKEMHVIMASSEGGVEIEEVASKTPEKIVQAAIDPSTGFLGYHGRKLAKGLGLSKDETKEFIRFAKALYKAYMNKDANMVEINPLIKTDEGKFLALDAKMGFDDNALGRNKDVEELRDLDEEEPSETEAGKRRNRGLVIAGAPHHFRTQTQRWSKTG